jgi:8-oxo-dGTP pyrophosphatase MutT (NUDIX family)
MSDVESFDQAGVIPYRRGGEGIEFCLVTSTKTRKWSFPKGTIKPGETAADTAARNALKEAGLRGRIVDPPLGTYSYRKWETTLEVTMLLMEVLKCEDQWEESKLRQRCWVSKDEAIERLSLRDQKELVQAAWQRLEQR